MAGPLHLAHYRASLPGLTCVYIENMQDLPAFRAATALLGLAILLNSSDVLAQSPGKFVATGTTTTQRNGHTATLLKDGRVLIAGGSFYTPLGKQTLLSSAELYDPSAGTFTPTGNMTTARERHLATLLADGRVLLVGGLDLSAELYDPATGTFTATGGLPTQLNAGYTTSAVLLSSGKVLITSHPMAQIYDPAVGLFTPAGPVKDWSGEPVVVRDGRVVIPAYHDISLYSITGDGLQLINSIPGNYAGHPSATLLANGKVLIAGGVPGDYDSTTNEAWLYNPRSGTLGGTGLMLFSRDSPTATLLPDGHVLIVGGYDGDAYETGVPTLTDAEDYDLSTGSFTSAGSLLHIRGYLHTTTLLPDGTVLIVGGTNDAAAAELYVPPLRAVSSASLNGPLAPASLASLFGSRLATATAAADPLSPPTSLGGISLRLHDSSGAERFAPLLYVSRAQINFEVPAGVAPGDISLEIENASTAVAKTVAQVNNIAPGLFAYDDNTVVAYGLRLEPNGKQTVLSVRDTIALDDRPVYLIAYATGIRNRSSINNVRCTIGGISMPVEYAGPEGSGVPGLDQVNLRLTSALKGIGNSDLVLSVDGVSSNTVSIDVR